MGQVFNEKYKVDSILGHGARGEVYAGGLPALVQPTNFWHQVSLTRRRLQEHRDGLGYWRGGGAEAGGSDRCTTSHLCGRSCEHAWHLTQPVGLLQQEAPMPGKVRFPDVRWEAHLLQKDLLGGDRSRSTSARPCACVVPADVRCPRRRAQAADRCLVRGCSGCATRPVVGMCKGLPRDGAGPLGSKSGRLVAGVWPPFHLEDSFDAGTPVGEFTWVSTSAVHLHERKAAPQKRFALPPGAGVPCGVCAQQGRGTL